jgi:hypothetical protein
MRTCTNFRPNTKVLDAFVQWIEQPRFDVRHAKQWAKLYRDDREAAMCEATFWAVLTDCGVDVRPNRDLTGQSKSPDFVCTKDNAKFYVETTCIRIDTATRKTGLQSMPPTDRDATHYALLNKAIVAECTSKTPQCAMLDVPCVLAIGTFHFRASVQAVHKRCIEWLINGEPKIAVNFDPVAGMGFGEPFQVTDYNWAAFLGISRLVGIAPRRQPISALLIGGLGCEPPKLFGVLHPFPIREFNPAILDRIPFCRKADSSAGIASAEWIQTPDNWES